MSVSICKRQTSYRASDIHTRLFKSSVHNLYRNHYTALITASDEDSRHAKIALKSMTDVYLDMKL